MCAYGLSSSKMFKVGSDPCTSIRALFSAKFDREMQFRYAKMGLQNCHIKDESHPAFLSRKQEGAEVAAAL